MAYNYIHFVGTNICVISSALQLHSLALKANQILWRRYSVGIGLVGSRDVNLQ